MVTADVYMAPEVAKISGKPIVEVVQSYKSNKGKGWGVIAKNLGIKPGSKEFKVLKNGASEALDKVKAKKKGKN
jgi:hypothetical protein